MNTFNGNKHQVTEIASILENISDSDLLTLNNDYCDDLMCCKTPTTIVESLASNFSIYDEYFRDSTYGLESGNSIEDLMQVNFEDLAKYLIENGDINDILADNEDTIKMEFINYATSIVEDNNMSIDLEDLENWIDNNISSEVYTEFWEDLVEQVVEDFKNEM